MTKREIKPLEQQIDEYKNQSEFHKLIQKERFNRSANQYEKYKDTNWHWDENWDGQLIRDVIALEQAGFTIVGFSRKRKVTLKPYQTSENEKFKEIVVISRSQIVDLILKAVGDTWYSISFKPTLSIYWKGRSSQWRY